MSLLFFSYTCKIASLKNISIQADLFLIFVGGSFVIWQWLVFKNVIVIVVQVLANFGVTSLYILVQWGIPKLKCL
ncbi:putative low-affinity putrescine importer PlaP [Frankliniella fusca]|uniref:Low-affinity putrescine importer PlaP n=1 Tax=Frankliniella fusca TaxID=407009 RepID=A0AAE1GTU9_9NEOP|nr:putative low-affinity putrescine importer PlaP [Frankliniella fusca]